MCLYVSCCGNKNIWTIIALHDLPLAHYWWRRELDLTCSELKIKCTVATCRLDPSLHNVILMYEDLHTIWSPCEITFYQLSKVLRLFFSDSIILFYRKSADLRKHRRTILHIPHIHMNMRGRAVIASHWISWLLATLVITWTSFRTLGQSSALWEGFVNSQWSAGMSDCENRW